MFKLFIFVLIALVTVNQANDYLNELNNETLMEDNEYEYGYDQDDDQGYYSNNALIERIEDLLLPEDLSEDSRDVKFEQASLQSLLDAYVRFGQYRQNVTQKLSSLTKTVINKYKDNFLYADISSECLATIRRIVEGINDNQPWASKFLTSQPDLTNAMITMKLPNNKYDECLSFKSPPFEHGTVISGQYCHLDLASIFRSQNNEEIFAILYPFLKNNSFIDESNEQGDVEHTLKVFKTEFAMDLVNSAGFCLPKNCEPKEITQFMNNAFYDKTKVSIPFDNDCDYKGKPSRWNNTQIYSISIILIFTMLVLLITSLEGYITNYYQAKAGFGMSIVNCFSAIKNTEKILSIRENNQFKCLAAFKVYFSLCVVVSNNFISGDLSKYIIEDDNRGLRFVLFFNIWSMDYWMLMSGIAVFLENEKRIESKKLNLLFSTIKRYCKVLPTLIATLLISFLFDKIGQGPNWPAFSGYITKNCMQTWYLPFTMINNFPYFLTKYEIVPPITSHCMLHSWYLGANMQLYILSTIILIPLIRRKYLGRVMVFIILAITILIPLLLSELSKAFNPVIEISSRMVEEKNQTVFGYAPWNYIPAYIFGIFLGFIVKNKQTEKLKLAWSSKVIIVILSIMSTIGPFYWKKNVLDYGYEFTGLWGYEKQVYLVVNKILYLSGFASIIFLCVTNNLTCLSRILNWKPFQVMANLSLQVFMLNVFFAALRLGLMREITTYSNYTLISNSVFDYLLAYLLSYVAYVIFIGPVQNIIGIFFSRFERQQSKTEKEVTKEKIINNGTYKYVYNERL